MSKEIALTKGKITIVDDDDYEFLSQWKWGCYGQYAARKDYISNKKRKVILMHRLINNTPDDLFTDHINGDPLDNRKENLRNCTVSENGANRKKQQSGTSSKYKGVSWKKNKWECGIKYHKKTIYLGRFENEISAAKQYDEIAKQFFGEFANLNFKGDNQIG